jgi:hypothetical protein
MGVTDFTMSHLVPALRRAGLTVDEIAADRKVQEVVYLLERAGLDLGFGFKWELGGPFSRDLADELALLDRDALESASLRGGEEDVIAQTVARLMRPPQDVMLGSEDWLRLLVSVDFVERRTPGATENGKTPPFIARNFDRHAIGSARRQASDAFAGVSG